MAVGSGIQIINLPQFNRQMNQIILKEQNYVKKQIMIACLNTQRGARRNAPVDSGLLRNRITYELTSGGFAGKIMAMTNYAYYVEFGTGRYASQGGGRQTQWMYKHPRYGWLRTYGQKPKFFMTNAWDVEKPQFLNRLRRFPK